MSGVILRFKYVGILVFLLRDFGFHTNLLLIVIYNSYLHIQIFDFPQVNLVEKHLVQDDAKVRNEQIFMLKLNQQDMRFSAP